MNILIISPEPWDYAKVSKHHYALVLSELGHEIYFLNPPNPKIFKKIFISPAEFKNIHVINYKGQLKGKRFLPKHISRLLDRCFINYLEKMIDKKIDVVWNFENSRFYDFKFAKNKLKIYHQVDLNQNFNAETASKSADICFCTTDYIFNLLSQFNERVFKVNHGVSSAAFSYISEIQTVVDQPVATLVGNLEIPYLNHDLLLNIVSNYSNVKYFFIGDYCKSGKLFSALSKYPNVSFTGKIPSEDIHRYLIKSDILLLCYNVSVWKEQVANPHKMMEYFASGKLVVATYMDEYKNCQDLLLMASTHDEYLRLFHEAVNNLRVFNTPELQAKRRAFALDNTYFRQLERINAHLLSCKLTQIILTL